MTKDELCGASLADPEPVCRRADHEILLVKNNIKPNRTKEPSLLAEFSVGKAEQVLNYHSTLPQYKATPLVELTGFSERIGVAKVWLKDESKRFNLNAFKVLGSSFALGRHILGDLDNISYDAALEVGLGDVTTLVSATDGNHGFGLAHVGKLYGLKVKIYMPEGTVPERAERIRRLGAQCDVTDFNYDKCVELAKEFAQKTNGLFVQDTALESDTEEELKIPLYIMQGYTTILQEIFGEYADFCPTHVFLQCGVGSFAAALTAYLNNKMGLLVPKIVIVEPTKADCFYQSAKEGGGSAVAVDGEMDSIMAGLCCGVPSTQAWQIIRNYGDFFFACGDEVTRRGMRILANPLPGDQAIVSGESGAVTAGLLYTLLTDKKFCDMKTELLLDHTSRVLLISTEGDTDPEGYYTNIWG